MFDKGARRGITPIRAHTRTRTHTHMLTHTHARVCADDMCAPYSVNMIFFVLCVSPVHTAYHVGASHVDTTSGTAHGLEVVIR